MIKPINRNILILNRKSEPATIEDMPIAMDLLDTLEANKEACVGLAANMIGINKRIIAIRIGEANMAMLNPKIIKKSSAYEAEERCLSLNGSKRTTRYKNIEVEFYDMSFEKHTQKFTGWTAQIIQHEVDHCNGILI